MRYRIQFSKTEAMRFTGNLDLHTTLERTMRRAALPLAYSEGFNPRPKLVLADALSLGITSEDEWLDCVMKIDAPAEEVLAALRDAAPPGIDFHSATVIDDRAEKLPNLVQAARFVATLLDPAEGLEARVADFLAQPEVLREKTRKGRTRTYDLRALVFGLSVLEPDHAERQRLELRLSQGEGRTARPDDVLDALGLDPLRALLHRTAMEFRVEDVLNERQ
jgi:radical SAM-linked protein